MSLVCFISYILCFIALFFCPFLSISFLASHWYYPENNPNDDQKIRDSFAKLRGQFPNLNLQEFDPIFDTVSDLCVEHERLAFYEGLRLGVTLMTELAE